MVVVETEVQEGETCSIYQEIVDEVVVGHCESQKFLQVDSHRQNIEYQKGCVVVSV